MAPPQSAFDFFPVNLPSGPEFLLIYPVICVLVIAVGKLVATLVASSLDRRTEPKTVVEGSKPVRFGAVEVAYHQRFTIGFLPHADELPGVGYLKHQRLGVVNALIGEAIADGWLSPVGARVFVGDPPAGASRPALLMHSYLRRGGYDSSPSNVRACAVSVAREIEGSVKLEVSKAGLVRPAASVATVRFVTLSFVAGALLIGGLRVLYGLSLGHPVSFLVLEMGAVALIGFKVSSVPPRTGLGDRYLAWLEAATGSLREDVSRGEPRARSDMMLAATVMGVAVIPGFAAFSSAMLDGSANQAFFGTSSFGGGGDSGGGGDCSGGGGCGGDGGGGGGGCGG